MTWTHTPSIIIIWPKDVLVLVCVLSIEYQGTDSKPDQPSPFNTGKQLLDNEYTPYPWIYPLSSLGSPQAFYLR